MMKGPWRELTAAEELLCTCTRCRASRHLTFPVSVHMGKMIFIWEYSDGRECWFGMISLPRAVIVNLPCETKSTENYLKESLPLQSHPPHGLSVSEPKACSASLALATSLYNIFVIFFMQQRFQRYTLVPK